jgi:hypothetical protein
MNKPVPNDIKLYEKVKKKADKIYKVHSAYKSGYIVRKYKELGGTYSGSKKGSDLSNWYRERWTNVDPHKTKTSYPVYRPSVRVSPKTPLTVDEIDKKDLLKKAKEKQKLKHKKLSPFKRK